MESLDGYVSKIRVNGKIYGLKCAIVEAYPTICKRCGASFELRYGSGQCEHCGTYYTTQFIVEETKEERN